MYEIYAALRDQKGVTDYAVAKSCHLGQSTFTDWKNGRITPNLKKMMKLADYFDVTIDYLVTGKIRGDVPPVILSEDERELLAAFRKLNDDAKAFLLDNALLFASSDKYKKAPSAASA